MRVNIYYGGRGLIDDPTLFTIDKISQVLDELRVNVERYNLYEDKSGISVLPKTLTEADGVILAASIEWLGIGGYLQQFLDACWLYGDKESIQHIYMLPVVMATTYGEREAQTTLIKAWEMLGGLSAEGIRVFVGKENPNSAFADSSVIISKYRIGQDNTGAMGLIGPIRMDYARLIPHLVYFSHTLGRLLGQTLEEQK